MWNILILTLKMIVTLNLYNNDISKLKMFLFLSMPFG